MSKTFKRWTEKEFEILDENFNIEKEELLKKLPDRTWKAITNRINMRDLPRDGTYKRYSKGEDSILRDNYHLPKEELMATMKPRSWNSIVQRCTHLDLDRPMKWTLWTEEEEDILRRSQSIDEALKLLPNRNYNMVRGKAENMNLNMRSSRYWTDEEDEYLAENYELANDLEEISNRLDKTRRAIYSRAHRLGLDRGNDDKTIKSSEIIEKYDSGLSIAEISEAMDITYHTVRLRLNRNGIYPDKIYLTGPQTPNWKGGITSKNKLLRGRREYRAWRISVFERDCYTCQRCGDDKGGNLHAHHIENFSSAKEKRHDINNGITLCDVCHVVGPDSFHMKYGTSNNNFDQLKEHIETYTGVSWRKL